MCNAVKKVVDQSICPVCGEPDFRQVKCTGCGRESTDHGSCPTHEPTHTEGYNP